MILNKNSNMLHASKEFHFIYIYIFLAFFLHLISVFFSIGFYNDDEHFQILEPTAYLLGLNEILIDKSEGYYWEWESQHRMRPWLQPYIYYYAINFLKILGINDPFSWSFFIRLFSSLVGFVSIIYLFFSFKKHFFQEDSHFNYLIFFSFWFYPFLHSRTSSANLGLILFILSFCYLYKHIKIKKEKFNFLIYFIFSFLLGISLVIKLNLIFTIAPIFLWVIFFRFNFYRILLTIIGVILALSFGLYVDFLNWGFFTNTYWQFYDVNINRGWMVAFGSNPWWYYIPAIAAEMAPILSIVFIIALIIFWIKKPLNVFTWLTLITLIIISCFSHKEIRYAFPIYIFAPFFICYFFEKFKNFIFRKSLKVLVIISNLIFLLITLFTPANGKVAIYNFLYKNNFNNEQNHTEVFYIDENPYLINNMEPFFYTKFLPKINNYKESEINPRKNLIIITNNYYEYQLLLKEERCNKLYNSYPEKIINLNENWKNKKLNWFIVQCKKNN